MATAPKYLALLMRHIRASLAGKTAITDADVAAAVKSARATAGGHARAANARAAVAESEAAPALDMDMATDGRGDFDVEDSYEDDIDDIEDALKEQYGPNASLVATFAEHIIWCDCTQSYSDPTFYQQDYTVDEATDDITFGDRIEVEDSLTFAPVAAEDGGNVALAQATAHTAIKSHFHIHDNGTKHQHAHQHKAGDGSHDTAVHAGSEGMVAQALDDSDPDIGYSVAMLRLADSGTPLPAWQQIHKIGKSAEPHERFGTIELTRDDAERMISNFRGNVVRRPIPLDAKHATDDGGEALGWLEDVRLGREGDGLPGAPDPTGDGDILYGRFRYTPPGQTSLAGEAFKCISPQYHRDYVDKETGTHYGPALLAVAATNNPFLRLRTIQGEPSHQIPALEDGLKRPNTTEVLTMAENQQLISLTEQVSSLQAEIKLRDSELLRERVVAWRDRLQSHGTPPAVVNLALPILLACNPRSDGVIMLDDAKPEEKVNLFAAVQRLVEAVPQIRLGGPYTLSDENRPPNETPGAADAQIDDTAIAAWAKEQWSGLASQTFESEPATV